MQQDIERLSKIGLSVHPTTLHRKLVNWQNILDSDILSARDSWANGGHSTYQIIGVIGIRIYCPPTGHLTERHYLCIYSICMQFLTGWFSPLKTMKARLITLNLQSLFHECLSKSNLCRSCALLSQHP